MDKVSINQRFVDTDDEGEAYELLFSTYHQPILKEIERMMWNHSDPAVGADDMTSKTFIKAVEDRGEVREPEKLLGWLLTIAKRLTLNEIRDAKKRRRAGNSPVESLESLSTREQEVPYASFLAAIDAEQAEANQYLVRQLLQLLQDKDKEIVELRLVGLKPKEIAETIDSTSEAVQKRLERIRKWLVPIAHNLEELVDCLPGEDDRKVMERHLDGQPPSDIAKAIGISRSDVEARVKRVIADWKKAARQNSTDPVSAMVKSQGTQT